jgi:arylsulfatase A-like enzyme
VERAIEIVTTLLRRYDPNKTLAIVASDHGELLGDGGLHHIYSLRDGNIKVPLYVKYSAFGKRRSKRPTSRLPTYQKY